MDSYMFYEEQEMLHYSEYEKLKEKVGVEQKSNHWRVDDVRMQSFHNKSIVSTTEKEKAVFYLEMNQTTNTYWFTKKVKQNHITYEAMVKLSKEGCKRLLGQEIDWLQRTDHPLLYEFSLLCKMEELEPDSVTECRREQYEWTKQSMLLFVHNLKCAKNSSQRIFDLNLQMFDCINCDQVILTVRKQIAFPILLRQYMPISC